jgi:serine/threonine protein kinase
VKPDNLLLSSDRLTLKLGDFGAARRLAPGGVLCECALLSDGTAGGTRAYTAPEVLMGILYFVLCKFYLIGFIK